MKVFNANSVVFLCGECVWQIIATVACLMMTSRIQMMIYCNFFFKFFKNNNNVFMSIELFGWKNVLIITLMIQRRNEFVILINVAMGGCCKLSMKDKNCHRKEENETLFNSIKWGLKIIIFLFPWMMMRISYFFGAIKIIQRDNSKVFFFFHSAEMRNDVNLLTEWYFFRE